ncbi:transaldolase [Synechococcus phage S-SM2]|uniref:Transaldolase-like protein n=1 Tax=Synechococcus phage S-SM2 TaxID=444860 RepID=E3SJE3_9CAUD|nr:transaldolase [Synechococcus phage S-SM2]ADO97591.1 transaldolase-like protein [Synechococcus phage S-SM2]
MKIFLDTADTDIIEKYFSTGLVDGVTTNPTLIMKSGKNPEDVYQKIKDIGVQDISMEVVGSDLEMYDEGIRLYEKFGDVCTVKVPCTREGLIVCKRLSEQGIRVNVTLIFCASQAVLAAKAGATYVSPFVGRLDDQSVAGLEVVRSITGLYQIHGIKTQVLSASIRSVQRAVRSWYNGARVVTMPPKVFDQMYDHILTDKGLEIFDQDWAAVKSD